MKWITYVGIDVAKDKLDVAIKITEEGQHASPTKRPQDAWTSENTDEGVAEIVRRLQELTRSTRSCWRTSQKFGGRRCRGCDRSDPRHRLHQPRLRLVFGRRLERLRKLLLDLLELHRDARQEPLDVLSHFGLTVLQAVAVGESHCRYVSG